ncbi:MAG: prepilin-type N-terminal cleavage/methylation domain-containing protein [Candidatus Erginobacter occultus]|nr:prepilin-type N-terminal cleavage/methylation domain-containing protein [Candidatus Erginobacter occultus]
MLKQRFKQPLPRRDGGFTVMEILIAITLGAVILASVYGSYHMVVKTTANYNQVSDIYQTGRIVLDTLAREISGAYQPLFAEKGEMFFGEDEWSAGRESDTLRMITTTSLQRSETEVGYDSYEISYYLGAGEKKGLLLMQAAPYFSLEEPFEEGEEIILAENVRALNFEYYDGMEWVKSWKWEEPAGQDGGEEDGEEPPVLPYGVRITLAVGLPEEEPVRFHTTAFLPMTPRPEEEEEEEEL